MALSEIPRDMDKLIEFVRVYIRDKEELNTLLDGKESNQLDINVAILMAIDDFNNTPPLIGNFKLVNFPSMALLVWGTVIQLLITSGILQSRNKLNYTDGGINVAVSDKADDYRAWIGNLASFYVNGKSNLKIARNIEGGFGGSRSEYSTIQGGFDTLGTSSLDGQSLAQEFGAL
jgi:hypothetical protein